MTDNKDQESKLQNELCWCIEQLSLSMESGKLSEKKGKFKSILHYRAL